MCLLVPGWVLHYISASWFLKFFSLSWIGWTDLFGELYCWEILTRSHWAPHPLIVFAEVFVWTPRVSDLFSPLQGLGSHEEFGDTEPRWGRNEQGGGTLSTSEATACCQSAIAQAACTNTYQQTVEVSALIHRTTKAPTQKASIPVHGH